LTNTKNIAKLLSMSLQQRKSLDEGMQGKLQRRMMEKTDSALGDWRFEDLRDEMSGALLDVIEHREEEVDPIELEAVDTDAQAQFRDEEKEEGSMQERGIIDVGYSRMFTSDLLSGTPNGTQDNPSMLLEIGGGKRPRPYSETDLQRKNVIVGNIDMFAEWGDSKHQCDLNRLPDGLDSSELERMFAGASLGSVAMSHTIKFLEPEAFERILETGVQKLSEGGRFTVLDMNVSTGSAAQMRKVLSKMGKEEGNGELNIHDFLYARILKAFAAMERLAASDPENLQFRRYALGPTFQQSIARKFMNGDKSKLQQAAGHMLTEGAVKLVKHPVTDATADDIHTIGSKRMLPMFAEAVLEIEKIDPEKERQQRRARNQHQRAEDQKKKRLRKQKKRSRR
jgi:hypothetical protein